MNIDVQMIVAFVAGILIPLFIALFGKEALGRWLLASQTREATALEALIGITQGAVAGWRESSNTMAQLVASLEMYKADTDQDRSRIFDMLQVQTEALRQIENRLISLVAILGGEAVVAGAK